jgi:formylglycine-generating enzyme required for sulfatase activity
MGKYLTRARALILNRTRGAELVQVPSGWIKTPWGWRWSGAFLLDVRPVTNHEYAQYIEATGARRPHWIHRPGFGEPEQPVVGVTLAEARAFARWAGKRLPTSLEWFRAVTGGGRQRFPWGDDEPHVGHAHFGRGPSGAPAPVTVEDTRAAGRGPYGHRELLGNVWEWCNDGAARGGFWGSESLDRDACLEPSEATVSGGLGFRCAR